MLDFNLVNVKEEPPIGIVRFDLKYRVKYANSTARKMLDMDTSPIFIDEPPLPEWLISLIHRERMKNTSSSAVISFDAEVETEHTSIKSLSTSLYYTDSGATMLFQDITNKKKVEDQIHQIYHKWILLTEAANHIIFHEEPKRMLDSLFNELSAYFEIDFYLNYIFHEESGKLRLMNYGGTDSASMQPYEWIEFGQAISGRVARDKKRIVIDHIENSEDSGTQLMKKFGIQCYACHPLLSYGKLIGTLSFGSSTRLFFSQAELELLDLISSQAAMALERTYLIAELKEKNTELTTNYQKLTEKEKQLRDIFNGALDGILLVDNEDRIVDLNPIACRMLEISNMDEAIGESLYDLLEVTDLRPDIGEVSVLLRNGKEIILEFTITRDIVPGRSLFIIRDITVKHKAAQAIIQAKETAEWANKSKSVFFSTLSHELRTPLNSILGYSQIMLDDPGHPLDETQTSRVNKILAAGKHLLDLINDILNHSQSELGKHNLNLEQVDMHDIVGDSVKLLQPLADKKNIVIENEMLRNRSIYVLGDAVKIKQIMINLLANAIKYNVVNGKIAIWHETMDGHAKMYIEDTGIGLSEEQVPLIFEPFYRIYHPEHNIEGTGIGLTIVKSFLTMMNGSVGVESALHKGSRFWFSLPLSHEGRSLQ